MTAACAHLWSSGVCLNCLTEQPAPDPIERGQSFAHRLLNELDATGHTPPNLARLEQWVRTAHDVRQFTTHYTLDGATGDGIYAIEAHTLEPCLQRGGAVAVVFHGAGRSIDQAAADTLTKIHQHSLDGP